MPTLPDSDEMNTSCPCPRSTIPGTSVAGELDRHAQVDVDRAVDLLGREALDRAAGGQRRVGDEDVHFAGDVGQPGGALRVGEVDRKLAVVAAEVLLQPIEHLGPPAGEDQLGAARVQRPRDRLADAPGRSRQQHLRTFDSHHVKDATRPEA